MTAQQAEPKYFTAAEVEAVTGFNVPQQNQMIARSVIIPSRNDVRPTGTGDKRLMSSETVIQFALTAEAMKIGVSTRLGAYAARIFTEPSPGRRAATLFPRGRSILILAGPTGPALINCELDAELAEFGASLSYIDVGAVVRDVNDKINKLTKD
jgi:hypothetical protein